MDWKHLYLKTNHLIAIKKVGSLQCYCLVTCACTLVYFQRWPVPDVWESLTTQEHKRRGRWGLVGYLQSGNVHVHTIFFQQPLRVVVQPSQSFQLHLKLVKGTNKFWSHKVQCTCTACVFAETNITFGKWSDNVSDHFQKWPGMVWHQYSIYSPPLDWGVVNSVTKYTCNWMWLHVHAAQTRERATLAQLMTSSLSALVWTVQRCVRRRSRLHWCWSLST